MVELIIHIPGEIRGKGRPRFGNGRTYTDAKTQNSEAWVRHCAVQAVGQPCLEGALALEMAITVAVPKSWSKRKQADAMQGKIRPTGKPDWDNLGKITDALNKIVWMDDSQIVDGRVTKHYGSDPGAVLTIKTV